MATVVAFIDARIGEPGAIVDRLPPDTDWYVLAADDDGIGQMRRILAGYSDLAAIHVVSHGGEGVLYLGSTTLEAGTLSAHAAALADIGAALSEDGDLLLYGCDVGRGDVGAAFVDALAGLTGADVAASADATGAAALGGNWVLEVATGAIEVASLNGDGFAALLAAFVSIAPQQAVRLEGGAGPTFFTFALIRSGDVGAQQTVDWSVAGVGSHPADAADFGGTLPSGTVTFGIGEVNKIVAVSVSGDSSVELDDTFSVTLSNASGGLVIQNGTTGGTIQNDDTSTVSIAPSSATKAEGNGGTTSFTFTVSLDQAGVADQTVGWSVEGDGAHPADAADFGGALPSGTASFAAGETSKTVTLLVSGDVAIEFDESFVVKLSGPSAGLALGTTSATGTAQNDDKSVVSIGPAEVVQPEGSAGTTPFVFTVSLDKAGAEAQTVAWAVTGTGTHPASAADFGGVLPSGTATFAAGETSKAVTVLVSGDMETEFDENFSVTLSEPSAGLTIGTGVAHGIIIDNDQDSVLSIAALSAVTAEGNAGTTSFTFTVSLDQPSAANRTVDWAVTGSGAHPADGPDFGGTLPAGTLTFAAGETVKLLSVQVKADNTNERDEQFFVTLSNASAGLALGTVSATVTIENDDFPTVSIAALSTVEAEGNVGTTSFGFTVSLDQPGVADQTVDWSVAGSGIHAADGADFGGALPAGTVTFAAGETGKTVTVLVFGDTTFECDEEFTLTLSNASTGLPIVNGSASATIQNDDAPAVSITALSAVKPEGNGDTTSFTFRLEAVDKGCDIWILWSLAGSGAHAADAADFGGTLPTGTVTFTADETTKIVTVLVSGDTTFECDEEFTLTLSNASTGLPIVNGSASGTIQNDDTTTVSIVALSAVKPEGDGDTTAFTFRVEALDPGCDDKVLSYSLSGSGAHPADAADFGGTLPTGTVTFAAGETSKTITVNVAGDTFVESDENFTVTLSNPSSGLTIGVASATGTILNDDATVSIAATDATKPEGGSGATSFTFTVTVTTDLGDTSTHEVGYWMVGVGPAPVDASDFVGGVLPTGTLTFAAGETSKTVTVEVMGDTAVEPDQSFTVTLSNPSPGLTLGTANAGGTIVNDDWSVQSSVPEDIGDEVILARAVDPDNLAGEWSTLATFTISAGNDDGLFEIDATGGISLATGRALDYETSRRHVLVANIVDNDGDSVLGPIVVTIDVDRPISIAAVDAVKSEGNGATIAFTFNVSWDANEASTICWTVTGWGDHAATASDFPGGVLPTGTMTFAPGETSKTITVEVAGDTVVEVDESFTVTLCDPLTGLALGDASAEGTILNDDATVSIAATDAVKAEGHSGTTEFVFGVAWYDGLGTRPFNYNTIAWSVTGTDATDFVGGVLPTGTLTFAPGETSKTITVEVAGDTVVEANETFTVTLSDPSPGLTIGAATANGTILNDDTTVSIVAANAVKPEGNAALTAFTFTLASSEPATICWRVAGSGGHAADASDFVGGVLPTGTVTFAPGETSKTIAVEVSGDTLAEADESFTVTLCDPVTGVVLGSASAEGTILNDDAMVSIGATDVTRAEGNSGTTSFGVSLLLAHPVSVDLADPGGNRAVYDLHWQVTGAGPDPADASDFAGGVLPSGVVTFALGETSKTITVEVSGDTMVEPDEGFTVTLSDPSPGLTLGNASAEGTILNDDATTPTILSIAASANAIVDGTGTVNAGKTVLFTVTMSQPVAITGSPVMWLNNGAFAVFQDDSGAGFTSGPGWVVLVQPGQDTGDLRVSSLDLAGGTIQNAAGADADLSLATGYDPQGTLVVDTTAPTIVSITTSGDGIVDGAGVVGVGDTVLFTVTTSEPVAVTGAPVLELSNGGLATLRDQQVPFVHEVYFTYAVLPGQDSGDLAVSVLSLASVDPVGASIRDAAGNNVDLSGALYEPPGTLVVDTLSIAAAGATKLEGDSGVTSFAFTVTVTTDLGDTATHEVGWWMAGIGPQPADAMDFVAGVLPSGTLTFAPGEVSKTISVNIAGDRTVEFDETFSIVLFDPRVGPLADSPSATGTILNDDKSSVSIATAGSPTCIDGDNDSYVDTCYMIVNLDQAPVIAQTVHWSTIGSGPSPASASDFAGGVLPSGTLTYAPGETSKTIALAIAHDTLVEPDEGFTVSLSGPSSRLVLGVTAASGTILNDDLHAHDDAYVVLEGRPLTVALDSGILINDEAIPPVTASPLTNPIHGLFSRLMEEEGIFYYTLPAGFTGIDSFTYRASGGAGGHDEGEVRIHVVPVSVGATTTLDLLRLTPEEQIAATYAAFFGRAADAAGHAFWVGQFNAGLPVQGAATLFANIASSFGISDEAKALYPFLANPFGASDSQIGAFLDSVYNNLFDRSSDALGLAYWTNQIRQTLQAGLFVGSVLVNIMSGAQDTAAGLDITTLMSKVAVGLHFVEEQNLLGVSWTDGDIAAATALLGDVTSDPRSVLVGIEHADFAAWSMDVLFEGQNAA